MAAPPPPRLLIAAAADLHPLQAELTEALTRTTGVVPTFTFGASGMLARQIENGAPFDIYLSANESFARDLEGKRKLLAGSVTVYALGRLGLWSKSGKLRDLPSLAGAHVVHIALPNPVHAPYGVAARELLRKKGLWPKLESRVVYGENVEQTLQFAESGNADACITAWSLLRTRGGILLPASDYPPVRQVAGIVATTRQKRAAEAVLRYLTSPAGRALLERYGFVTP